MQITLVAYDHSWPSIFKLESTQLVAKLKSVVLNIHHIGSTSVPGLMAKPIIDILLEVSDLGQLDRKKAEMEDLGYEVMGEYGIPGRRYFRKGGDQRSHHIHAFLTGAPHINRHLAFRDYLIEHPEIAKAYADLKREIIAQGNTDLGSYSDQKDPFIKIYEEKALRWYEKRQG